MGYTMRELRALPSTNTNWRSIGIELYLAQGGQDEEAHSDS